MRTLLLCQGVLSFGLGLAFPFLALYLHRERGLSMPAVGGWLSLSMLAMALGQGLGGELSDRFGRRRVMLGALWSRAAGALAMAAAVGGALPLFLAAHLVSSFTASFFEPAARGWIADHAKDRHRAFALLRTATHGGFALGPAAGGLLLGWSYGAVLAASAVICAAAATAALRLRDKGRALDVEAARPPADSRFLRLCLLNSLLAVTMAQLVAPLSVYAASLVSDAEIGLLLSLNGALTLLLLHPRAQALAPGRALVVGSALAAAGWALVGWAGGLAGLALGVAVLTLGEILGPPAVHTLAAEMAPERARGRYLGFLGLSRQLGAALGPAVGLAGLHHLGGRHWLAVSAVAIVAAAGFRFLLDEGS